MRFTTDIVSVLASDSLINTLDDFIPLNVRYWRNQKTNDWILYIDGFP